MGLFDTVRRAFRRKDEQSQTEPPVTEAAPEVPEASLSPLPKAISGMARGRNIDRLGMMKAENIGFGDGYGPEQKDFWEYKEQTRGHGKADYIEMASHIPEVRDRLNNGESLDALMQDGKVGACALQYFSPENMITLERCEDGHYEYASGGRHRIAAARELGIDIPVQINEYGKKADYPISAWEKQDRYDALMDYMREHGYREEDREVYESDPEWQSLYKEFDHPAAGWEKPEMSDLDINTGDLHGDRYWEIDDTAEASADSGQGSVKTAAAASSDQSVPLSDRYQSSYDDRIRQTPSLESDRWSGDRGESVCSPQSDAARQILEERGISGVQYHDGVPDFSPFSESTVKLGYMTDARHSEGVTGGRDGKNTIYAHFEDGETVSVSHRADKSSMADLHMKYSKPGNFEQADVLAAEQWTAEGRDGREWTADDVAQYREDHGLTWHECNDMETMQMIPEAVNADFGHLGGVGEYKETQRILEEALQDYDEGQMLESEDYERMTPEELAAAARDHGQYTDEGVWIPEESPADPVDEATDQDVLENIVTEDIDQGGNEGPGELADSLDVDSGSGGISDNPSLPDEAVQEYPDGTAEVYAMDADETFGEKASEKIEEPANDDSADGFEDPVSEDAGEGLAEVSAGESAKESAELDSEDAAEPVFEESAAEPVTEGTGEETEEPVAAVSAFEENSGDDEEPASVGSPDEMEEAVLWEEGETVVEPGLEDAPERADEAVFEEPYQGAEASAGELVAEELEDPSAEDAFIDAEEQVMEDAPEEIEEPAFEETSGETDDPVSAGSFDETEKPVLEEEAEAVWEPGYDETEKEPEGPTAGEDFVEAEEPVVEASEEIREEPVFEDIPEETEEPAPEQIFEEPAEPVVEDLPEKTGEPEEFFEETGETNIEDATEPAEQPVLEESAAEEAAEDTAEDDYGVFADEQPGEEYSDIGEYSDLADEPAEESPNDFDFSDLSEDTAEDGPDDTADFTADEPTEESLDAFDYSDLADDAGESADDTTGFEDLADDTDTGSFDDSSFDSSEDSFDSGDTDSFDGGGDSFE